jgi:hypothetical protein
MMIRGQSIDRQVPEELLTASLKPALFHRKGATLASVEGEFQLS